MYFEFRIADLREAGDEIEDILEVVNEIEDLLNRYVNSTANEMQGKFSDEVVANLEDKLVTIVDIQELLEDFKDKLDEIIEIIEASDAAYSEYQTFSYEPKKFNRKLETMNELLNLNSRQLRRIIELSDTYQTWENSVTRKLDNVDVSTLKDVAEEMRQADDEKVFRHNRQVMQGLESEMTSIIGLNLVNSLDNIEQVKNNLDKLGLLDEVAHIGALIVQATNYGDATSIQSDIAGIEFYDALEEAVGDELQRKQKEFNQQRNLEAAQIEEMKESITNSIPDEVRDMAIKFSLGGKLVVSSALITDDTLQKIDNVDFFEYINENGQYKFAQKYDTVSDWARNNTKLLDSVSEKAMKNGLSGIYKLDPKTKKWYTYDKNGQRKMYSELPDGVGKTLTKASKVLKPLGYAISADELYQSWKTHDPSEFGATAGGIAGGFIGGTVGAAIATDGGSVAVAIIVTALGTMAGAKKGEKIGESIGNLFEEKHIYWENDENTR